MGGEKAWRSRRSRRQAIAEQVGLPTSIEDPFVNEGMIALDRQQAAHVLAVAGTTSLAYGRPSPRQQFVIEAQIALKDLAEGSVFIGNGQWTSASPGWSPMTSATFDCGLIGFDRENAFIFWVEEED